MRKPMLLLLLLTATAAHADDGSSADITVTGQGTGITVSQRKVPQQLNGIERVAYAQIFRDIAAGRYAVAETALAALPDGLLTGTARAQMMVARSSTGKATLEEINTWLAGNADLPQTPKVVQLAQRLGTLTTPAMPVSRLLRNVTFSTPMTPRTAQGFGLPGDAPKLSTASV